MSQDLKFSKMLDGQLSPEEQAELFHQLEHDGELRKSYAEFCQLHAMLEFDQDSLKEMAGDFPREVPPATPRWYESNLVRGFGAAAAIAAIAVAAFTVTSDDDEVVIAARPPSPTDSNSKLATYNTEMASLLSHPVPPYDTPVHVEEIQFNKHIRPILSDNCFSCHGPDSASRKGDLRLDREADAKEFAIVPGNPDESELVFRLETDDTSELMPPPKSHKTLNPQEIVLIKRWIAEGAPWQEHWAFIKPAKAEGSGIDHFVDAELKVRRLTPEPEADRQTLIRRVTLDLTGLPPTPTEVATFVADQSPNAYEKLVDRLLSSPRYGEHRARYWLDAARYADTHGLHLDNYREMWPYRDWVIQAYNANQPFDQFTIEQLAGDLLPEPTQSQLVATGFNRCNVTTSEGGAIAEEFLVRYAVDRVNTTSSVWLGLTTGCAQCHDHKFDPISQTEYFQLFAYFNHTTQPGMDGNQPDTPPIIRVYPDAETKEQETVTKAKLGEIGRQLKAAKKDAAPAFQAWRESKNATVGHLRGHQNRGAADFSVNFGKDQPMTIFAEVAAPDKLGRYPLCEQLDENGRGFRMVLDLFEEGVELTFFDGEGGMLQAHLIKHLRPGSRASLSWVYDGSGRSEGVVAYSGARKMGRERFPYLEIDTLAGDFANDAPLKILADGEMLKKLEFYDALTADEIKGLNSLSKIPGMLSGKMEEKPAQELLDHFHQAHHEPTRKLYAQQSEAQMQLNQIQRSTPITHVMADKPGTPSAPILDRGEYDHPTGEIVQPGVPAALPKLSNDAPMNRLGLAQWIVDPENPLTARVTVNRIWQEFFGAGLVETADDFGTQGSVPTHPELLNWLAVDFVENGWDVKRLVKQIVMSQAYRRGSKIDSRNWRKDPENRYYARGPRFRMDAEMIRDQALFASGLLVEKIGGPGVRPYQPGGLWQSVGYENSNTVKFFRHYNEALYRRSIYTFWKRTAPPPNMTAFDAPNRESCIVNRERTNTPLQALVLMNDVQFVEAARHLAERCLQLEDPVQAIAMHVLGREFAPDEYSIAANSLRIFREHYRNSPEEAKQLLTEGDKPNSNLSNPVGLASLTMVANQLLNLDEAVTKH